MGIVGPDSILGAVGASDAGQEGHLVHCDVVVSSSALVMGPDSIPVVTSFELSVGQAGHTLHTHGFGVR